MNLAAAHIAYTPTFSISKPTSTGVRELSLDGEVFARLYLPFHPAELTAGTEQLYTWVGVTINTPQMNHVCELSMVDAIQSLMVLAGVSDDRNAEPIAEALVGHALPLTRYTVAKEAAWRIA